MVQINHSLGANGLTNLGSAKKVQVSGENDKKPQTVINELQIWREDKDGIVVKIFDDLVDDGKRIILDENGDYVRTYNSNGQDD